MKITFVQNDKERNEAESVIHSGLRLGKKIKKGVWVMPPSLSVNDSFVVVDSPDGKDVYVESFDTIDGALMYALGIVDGKDGDRQGSLRENKSFTGGQHD